MTNLYYNVKLKLFLTFYWLNDILKHEPSLFYTSLLLFLLIFKAYFLFVLFPILFLGIRGVFCFHFSLTLSCLKPSLSSSLTLSQLLHTGRSPASLFCYRRKKLRVWVKKWYWREVIQRQQQLTVLYTVEQLVAVNPYNSDIIP